ncbi:hypothetical protein [Armatimonas rosea]|uniref:Uncharacterized protein n=1 Tax=Armatimonas rosea TaxID=685828 RepID=A0A7W9SX16_ARMRO|nr:hypothetical protein [Armatimonas rosea]MBB6053950.1 hypothetical protein [Armatimonas rosea]
MSAVSPTIDKRLAAVCQRLRGLAAEIEEKWHFGVVHLFTEQHVIQAHRGWRIEVPVPELDDYIGQPEDGELVPLPLGIEETSLMLRRVVEECKGVRGITSPCAPNPELLQDILDLLKRQPIVG